MEKMEKKNLNNHTMNEAIAILKEASMKSEKRSNFTIKCDNCTLDIVCGGEFNICDEVIEVALFTVNGETWHPLNIWIMQMGVFLLKIDRLSTICL